MISVPLPPGGDAPGVEWTALRQAIRHAGEFLQAVWVDLASGELVNRYSGDYVNHITPGHEDAANALQYPFDGDAFAVGVFNHARHAPAIEYGFASFNLADRVQWGTGKTRPTKSGSYILRIPFRHSTPPRAGDGRSVGSHRESMPQSIHEVASRMRRGERLTFDPHRLRTNMATVRNGSGAIVGVRGEGAGGGRYVTPTRNDARAAAIAYSRDVDAGGGKVVTQYPSHLRSPASQAAAVAHAQSTGQPPPPDRRERSIYEGLFRSGEPGHEQYTTIRTLTPHSQWWIPGRPGMFVAKRVADENAETVREALAAAAKMDVERALATAIVAPGLGGPVGGGGA